VNILGLVTVAGDGGAERSGLGGAPAALLGLLALHVNAAVSRHAIVDALWGERPRMAPSGCLSHYIVSLRRCSTIAARGAMKDASSGTKRYRLNLQMVNGLLVFQRRQLALRRAPLVTRSRHAECYERALGL
jgi:DNA-binding SARP family transcriptional activator